MSESGRFVDAPFRYERVDGAGHWMRLEAPDQVSALLLAFVPKP